MTQTTKNDVLERMLRFMVEKRASDLYLSANSPPMVRIHGLMAPLTSQPLGVQAPRDWLFCPAQAREAVQRVAACEVMMNTTRIAELIQTGNFAEIPEAMEQSLSLASQSFEQDIARLINDGKVDLSEGLAHADSATNLNWRMQNSFSTAGAEAAAPYAAPTPAAGPITLTINT